MRELNVGMRLTTRQVKEAVEAGDVILWDGKYLVLGLEQWAGAVSAEEGDHPRIIRNTPSTCRHHHKHEVLAGYSIIVFDIERQAAAWVVLATPEWRETVKVHDSLPAPSYLIALGLRRPPDLLTLTEAAEHIGTNRRNVWAAARAGTQLKTEWLDGRQYVRRAELERWARERRPGRRKEGG